MSLTGEHVLLRVYLQTADRTPRTPTYERIVRQARSDGLAGATVLRGLLGLGSHGVIRRSAWSIVEHVPVIVEIVDSAEKIKSFVDRSLAELLVHGLATLERASVMMYRHAADPAPNELNSSNLTALAAPLSTVPQITTSEHMKIDEQGVLLRIFIGESDRYEGRPLYEAIVHQAAALQLAGATVLRGSEGFGAHSVVHESKLLEMSRDLPLIVEIVDSEDKIKLLLPALEKMVQRGMVTMEHVLILMYRPDPNARQ
jgi:PII-like signaling protein